ncbi:hypothetical protein HMPREF3232_00245 [Fannyhessea vaginae]|nr:hypothetical protein HMPREF3232_00245 [Fannyhessea vaginae]
MHVETVALLSKLDIDKHISVEIELDELDLQVQRARQHMLKSKNMFGINLD